MLATLKSLCGSMDLRLGSTFGSGLPFAPFGECDGKLKIRQ
jgi:hypothetical protein